ARTPMQWDSSVQAGFTTGEPWLPVGPPSREVNLPREAADHGPLITPYKRLISPRGASPALTGGGCSVIQARSSECLLYERLAHSADGAIERILVVVNFSPREVELALPERARHGQWLRSTDAAADAGPVSPRVRLAPNEGRLARLHD